MSWPWHSGQSGQPRPGIGGADDDPDRDQPESGREGQRGELLEAVHEALILPGRRLPAARDTLSAMTPRRWLPLLVLLALVAVACGIERLRPRRPPRRDAWGPPATPPKLTPVLVTNAIAKGKARILFLYLDSKNAVASAPDRKAKVAFYDLATDPAKPVTTVDGEFVWTIENERGMYVVNADFPTAGTWGAEFTTEAPSSPRRDRPTDVRRPRIDPDDQGRREGTGIEDADRGRCRRGPHQDLDRRQAGPGVLPDLGRRRARRPQAVHARLRDAEVLHQPAVRPDARPVQADRRGQPGRHVHQRRALPAEGRRRGAPAGPRRQRPAPGDRRDRRVGPALRTVDLRGRPRTASSRARTS